MNALARAALWSTWLGLSSIVLNCAAFAQEQKASCVKDPSPPVTLPSLPDNTLTLAHPADPNYLRKDPDDYTVTYGHVSGDGRTITSRDQYFTVVYKTNSEKQIVEKLLSEIRVNPFKHRAYSFALFKGAADYNSPRSFVLRPLRELSAPQHIEVCDARPSEMDCFVRGKGACTIAYFGEVQNYPPGRVVHYCPWHSSPVKVEKGARVEWEHPDYAPGLKPKVLHCECEDDEP